MTATPFEGHSKIEDVTVGGPGVWVVMHCIQLFGWVGAERLA